MFFKHTKWAMLWALVILILCGMPGKDIPHISFLELLSFDKLVHAGIFCVLLLLMVRGFRMQDRFILLQEKAMMIALLICIAYGGALEIMQGIVFEQRSPDIYDFIANTAGALLGSWQYKLAERRVLVYFIR
jgi:VanZ family protein